MLRRDNSVAFADYFQYACVGLVEAVDRFEPDRPVLFETFATYRIRGAVLNGLAKESELAAQRHYSGRPDSGSNRVAEKRVERARGPPPMH